MDQNENVIAILQNSLYAGARPESIRLVLGWCAVTGRDPMKKPIHIVPMRVKDKDTGRWEWRDTLMPGIGTYRSDAAGTGAYAGKDEPEFGPDRRSDVDGCELTYPEWCKVTVKRLVGGHVCCWTAKELWIENYASGEGGKGVNAMWRKRPYGQLAKVAEAQALRMAFPDETGNTNTAEEMEGKSFEGPTIEAEKPAVRDNKPITRQLSRAPDRAEPFDKSEPDLFAARAERALDAEQNGTRWLKLLDTIMANAQTLDEIAAVRAVRSFQYTMENAPTLIKQRIDDMVKAAVARLSPEFDQNGNGHAEDANGDLQKVGDALRTGDTEGVIRKAAEALRATPEPEEAEPEPELASDFPGDRP